MAIDSSSLGGRGLPGRDGRDWHISEVEPPPIDLGDIRDLCICTPTNTVYRKRMGGWTVTSVILVGAPGPAGWAPKLANVIRGDDIVWQIVDWIGDGDEGEKPAVGQYIGAEGYVDAIGDAGNVRGLQGIQGIQGVRGAPYHGIDDDGDTAGRAAHDAEVEGFAYLDTELMKIFVKQSDTSGDWDVGVSVEAGPQGEKGWSPIPAGATDGDRKVIQVVDWVGGEGTKPATGQYIGAAGLTGDIASAVNFRGEPGADSTVEGPAGAQGDPGVPFNGVQASGTIAGRDAYDAEAVGFSYRVDALGGDPAIIYTKQSGTSADWDEGFEVPQGPAGAPGADGVSPDLSDATPVALGTAVAGVAADASRSDHVHPPADLAGSSTTGTLPITKGGTGATTAANARTALELGSMALQPDTSVDINGGTVDAAVIGGATPAAGTFTDVTATGAVITAAGAASAAALHPTGDPNTGPFFPGADQWAMACGGTEVIRGTATATVVGKTTPDTGATAGIELYPAGSLYITRAAAIALVINRLSSDGNMIDLRRDGSSVAVVSVASGVVTWGTFTGSHWVQFGAGKPQPKRRVGTILSTIDEMCRWLALEWEETIPAEVQPVFKTSRKKVKGTVVETTVPTGEVTETWPARVVRSHVLYGGEAEVGATVPWTSHVTGRTVMATVVEEKNTHLARVKVSDVPGDRSVYTVWMGESLEEDGSNPAGDHNGAGLGTGFVLVKGEIANGDHVVSGGDGTGVRLDPDTPMTSGVHASLVAKITAAIPQPIPDLDGALEWPDGARLYPCVYKCG